MRRYMQCAVLLLAAWNAHAQSSWLPLDAGNFWTYKERSGHGALQIRVGTPERRGEHLYYPLSGYGTEPLLVRWGDADHLLVLDKDGQERVLTSFDSSGGGPFAAPFRVCEQEGQAQSERQDYKGPAGRFGSVAVIRYRSLHCADAGIQEELYAPNIGMVQRTETSFAGPRVYDLVSARAGSVSLHAGRGAALRLSVRPASDVSHADARLALQVQGEEPVTLRYLSAQEFDLILRSADGKSVWQWSSGRVFPAVVRDETTFGKSWVAEVPLKDKDGKPLPPGRYQLEGWIASGYDRPQFAATVDLVLPAP